jgi:hypothetical protein
MPPRLATPQRADVTSRLAALVAGVASEGGVDSPLSMREALAKESADLGALLAEYEEEEERFFSCVTTPYDSDLI